MKLVPPSLKYERGFRRAVRESNIVWEKEIGEPKNIAEYIRMRHDHSEGKHLPKTWVPATTLWLVENGGFIGEVHIRHRLTDHLRKIGGHIGYWIRSSERGKGYGKEILSLALIKATALGIKDVLITCDETNAASRKIIETNGGILERAQDMGPKLPRKLLFWIRSTAPKPQRRPACRQAGSKTAARFASMDLR